MRITLLDALNLRPPNANKQIEALFSRGFIVMAAPVFLIKCVARAAVKHVANFSPSAWRVKY
jgi:hypothetical protein